MEDRARPLRALPRGQSPPPPLQTSSDAEVMDVGSGGDGQAEPPAEDPLNFYGVSLLSKGSSSKARLLVDPNCSGHSPRTARHAPAVRKFSPDLKLLKDVKISVSFTESCRSEDRKVLYTGAERDVRAECGLALSPVIGDVHAGPFGGSVGNGVGAGGESAGKRDEEHELDQEKRVEYAVLDELEDFTDNLELDEEGAGGFTAKAIVQRDRVDEEALNFSYEVCRRPLLWSTVSKTQREVFGSCSICGKPMLQCCRGKNPQEVERSMRKERAVRSPGVPALLTDSLAGRSALHPCLRRLGRTCWSRACASAAVSPCLFFRCSRTTEAHLGP